MVWPWQSWLFHSSDVTFNIPVAIPAAQQERQGQRGSGPLPIWTPGWRRRPSPRKASPPRLRRATVVRCRDGAGQD